MRDRRRFDFPCIVYALRAPVWILDSERAVLRGNEAREEVQDAQRVDAPPGQEVWEGRQGKRAMGVQQETRASGQGKNPILRLHPLRQSRFASAARNYQRDRAPARTKANSVSRFSATGQA